MILSSTSRILRTGAVAVAVVAATLALPLAPASADATFNQQMLGLVNRERAANGLTALVADPTLSANAEDAPYSGCGFTVFGRAKDMGERNYFSHTILGCLTQSVFNILNTTGLVYSGAAENIAWLNGTTDPVVAAENLHGQLMNSSGHRANILNPTFTKIGIGSWRTSPGQTWSGGGYPLTNVFIGVQIFAGGPVSPTTTVPPTTVPPTTVPPTTVPPTTVPPTTSSLGRFNPLSPARILDTRDGTGGLPGALSAGSVSELQVNGRGGVSASDVAAVAMTVTVTAPTAAGFLTMYPSGTARPQAAILTFPPGETVSNMVVLKVASNGRVSMYSPYGRAHVIVDVVGWYSSTGTGNAGRFESVTPSRILDTRTGTVPARLAPGASLELQVAGRGGIPSAGAQALVMNVTVTNTASAGYLTAYPAGQPRPLAASLTFGAGRTVGARVAVKLGVGGKVTIFNGGTGPTDVVVDVSGWYTDSSTPGTLGVLGPLSPVRILDTRDGNGGVFGPMVASGTVDVPVAGRGGVPASGARAVMLTVTVTSPAGPGFLTLFPAGTARPLASDINFAGGDTRSNLVVVQLGAGGKLSVFAAAGTHVIFDLAGWVS